MKLHEIKWLCNFVDYCRKWHWFDHYIWGQSKSFEDFFRNPAEVFLDECIGISNCKGFVLLGLRFGFIRYLDVLKSIYRLKIPTSISSAVYAYRECKSRKLPRIRVPFTNFILFDATWFDEFEFKYPNAFLSFNVTICYKLWHKIPIILPGFNLTFRFSNTRYFQAGIGWCPRYPTDKWTFKNGSAYGKLRIGNYKNELLWNPDTEVYGFWEGSV
jgi:hypothetical protein